MLWTNHSVRIKSFSKTKTVLSFYRKYTSATNRLQQRTIDVFYRILINNTDGSTQYGAFIGLCEMGHKVSCSSNKLVFLSFDHV
jgi:hypothetical protein